jgi:hypothetical protein
MASDSYSLDTTPFDKTHKTRTAAEVPAEMKTVFTPADVYFIFILILNLKDGAFSSDTDHFIAVRTLRWFCR